MMTNGHKMTAPPEVAVQQPESNVAVAGNGGKIGGPHVGPAAVRPLGRKADVLHVTLRLLCMVGSVTALSFMVTAHQSGTVSIYGFMLPLYSKWSFSHSFEYLVGVSVAVAAHSLLQLLLSMSRLLRKFPVVASRTHAWILFAGDQMFAYAMMSAGSAASGVTNLNRTGIQHTAMPDFCKPLSNFCGHIAVSVAFTFFSCFLLAASAIQEVLWLSKSKY